MKNRYNLRNAKRLFVLFISLFFAGSIMSQVIVDETFNYTNGSLLTANGYSQTASSTVNLIKVDSTNLTYTGYTHSGVGKSIVIDTAGEDIYKTFTAVTSGDVYVSFLLNIKKATTTGDYFYCMSPNPFATTYTVRTYIKADANGNLAFGILKGSTAANTVYTGYNYSLNTTYLVVLRYSILTSATNDSISMWINPVTGSTMPVQTVSTADNSFADAVNIGSLVFRQGTAANAPRVQLSGLRVSSTWADLFGTVTPTVATPTFTPAAGTYTSAQNVTINCSTSGASVYYTLDGTDPTTASTLYSAPISVSTTKTIKARGYKTGMDSSAVASALYTMNIPTQVATPTFSPVAGTYTSAQNVTISSTTTGATFRYTLDGTDPTSTSTLYTGPITISSTKTLKARGYFTGLDSSAVASGLYTMNIPTQVATPTFSPVAGTFTSIQNVTISCATVGAAIRYTLDGTDPVSTSLLYSTPLSIGTTTTLKARGFLTGLDSSLVASGLYTINIVNVVATPTLSPLGGNFINQPTVTISCTTPGASIYYTLDGTNPTTASTLYSTPITITQTKILKTRGFKIAYDSSALVTGVYSLKVDTVHSSVAAGNYFATQNVVLTTASVGANIHYTLDGTTPTSASALYSAAIPISISSTLKARAFATGWDSSIVSSWAYTITAPPVSLPFVDTFNLAIGSLLTANGYTAHSSGTNAIKVSAPALTYYNYPKSNNGNAIQIDTTGEDISKKFVPRTSNAVYASFLVKISKATTTGDYFFHFGPDTISTTFRGRVFVKSDVSGALAFGISKASTSSINYTAFNYALNTNYLVVVRYNIIPGLTNDSIDLWINPTMANMPSPLVSCPDISASDPTNIGTFAFRQGSSSNMPRLLLSGLMIDTSWTNMFAGVPPQVATPTFSPASGTYTSVQSVTISTTTSGASIYYTTNGTDPTMASTLYTAPINVNTSMVLKAKAYKTGYDSSFVGMAGYMINLPVIATVVTNAATSVSIHTTTLNGEVTNDGGAVITERGFCYSTTPNPTTASTKLLVSGTTGIFNGNVQSLLANTTYYFKAYAINSAGTSYGTEMSFTTLVDGIDASQLSLISLYPNPAKNSVSIKNAENYTISVYSIVGQIVKQSLVKTNQYTMDISELPSGIYIMSFQYGDKKFNYRLTKQ